MANRRNLLEEAMATVQSCDVFILGGPLEAAGLLVGLLAPQRAVPVLNHTITYPSKIVRQVSMILQVILFHKVLWTCDRI